jgi:hypothetical protein
MSWFGGVACIAATQRFRQRDTLRKALAIE